MQMKGKSYETKKESFFGKQMLSMFLAVVLLLSGMTVPFERITVSHTSIFNMMMAGIQGNG